MPAGVTIPAGAQVVTGGGSAPVKPDGTFSVGANTQGMHIVTLQDANGSVILFGNTMPDGTVTVDAQHTAAAMLYFGLGLWQAPQTSIKPLMTDLLSLPETTTLAQTISTRVAASITAVNDGDSQIMAAEAAAEDSIAPRGSGGTRGVGKIGTIRANPETVETLIQPPASSPQSGAAINADTSDQHSNKFQFVNDFRRPFVYYVYHTADVDSNGKTHPITPYKLVEGPIDVENPEGLSVLTTLKAMIGKPVPWNPTFGPNDDSLSLTTNMNQSVFRVVSVGPSWRLLSHGAPWSNAAYAASKNEWQRDLDELNFEAFTNDFALPLLVGIDISPLSSLTKDQLKSIDQIIEGDAPDVATLVKSGDFQAALKRFVAVAKDNPDLVDKIRNILKMPRLQPLLTALKWLYKVYGVIDRAMSFGDVAKSVNDLSNSNVTDEWEIKLVKTQIKLTPTTAAINPGGSQTFTAQVVGGGTGFRYQWDAGHYGTVDDGHGKTGDLVNTDQPTVTYVASKTAPTSGTDTVSLTVFDAIGNEVGTTSATLTFSKYPAPGTANVTVSSVDAAIADKYKPTSYTVPRVGSITYYDGSGGGTAFLLCNFEDNSGAHGASISIAVPGQFSTGQHISYGTGGNGVSTGAGVSYLNPPQNGITYQASFSMRDGGSFTIDSYDGKTLSFTATGHFIDVVEGDGKTGAEVRISGTVQVG